MSVARWTSKEYATYNAKSVKKKVKAKKVTRIDLFPDVCVKFGLPRPTPEYKFHPARKWRIDYYFEANGRKVGLEVEGGIWTGGRHIRGAGFSGDMEKYNAAGARGITIFRVAPSNLLKTETFDLVKKTLYA